jgi:hypothetical protein
MIQAASPRIKSCCDGVSADVTRLCTATCLWAVYPPLGGYAYTK